MSKTARRFTIISLSMLVFALLFAQLVQDNGGDTRRVHLGTSISCLHPATPACTIAL